MSYNKEYELIPESIHTSNYSLIEEETQKSKHIPSHLLGSLAIAIGMMFSQDAYAQTSPDVSSGRPVEACEFPSLASVTDIRTQCSAEILDTDEDGIIQFVLTAAHCVSDNPKNVTVNLGHIRNDYDNVTVSEIIPHETEDIALLQLTEPIAADTCNVGAKIAESINYSQTVTLAGFGLIDPDKNIGTHIAHTTTTPIIDNEHCNSRPNNLCIGYPDKKRSAEVPDIQSGDSGSAVLQMNEDKNRLEVVGVSSQQYKGNSISFIVDVTEPEIRDWVLTNEELLEVANISPTVYLPLLKAPVETIGSR